MEFLAGGDLKTALGRQMQCPGSKMYAAADALRYIARRTRLYLVKADFTSSQWAACLLRQSSHITGKFNGPSRSCLRLTQHFAHAPRWSTQLASALAYLHGRSPMVIFRDLSAANVLLTSTCSRGADVKLVDFGLAKLLPSQAECMQQGAGGACPCNPILLHVQSALGGDHLLNSELLLRIVT